MVCWTVRKFIWYVLHALLLHRHRHLGDFNFPFDVVPGTRRHGDAVTLPVALTLGQLETAINARLPSPLNQAIVGDMWFLAEPLAALAGTAVNATVYVAPLLWRLGQHQQFIYDSLLFCNQQGYDLSKLQDVFSWPMVQQMLDADPQLSTFSSLVIDTVGYIKGQQQQALQGNLVTDNAGAVDSFGK